jgi:hypothetical protein
LSIEKCRVNEPVKGWPLLSPRNEGEHKEALRKTRRQKGGEKKENQISLSEVRGPLV